MTQLNSIGREATAIKKYLLKDTCGLKKKQFIWMHECVTDNSIEWNRITSSAIRVFFLNACRRLEKLERKKCLIEARGKDEVN